MLDGPCTFLSCGRSIDGYLGNAAARRLEPSDDADFDRVDAVRASDDAILVGAVTVRNDNPRLLARPKAIVTSGPSEGLRPWPITVTVTERFRLVPRDRSTLAGVPVRM